MHIAIALATALASAQLNDRASSTQALLMKMGLPNCDFMVSGLANLQLDRDKHAARKQSEVRKRREQRRRVHKGIREEVAQEGVSYEVGGF